jgi:hypothetical protein
MNQSSPLPKKSSLLLFLLLLLLPAPFAFSQTGAPQTVYVYPDGTIKNTTDFEFKLGKLQVCDAAGNNCVAVDAALAARQPLDPDLTTWAGITPAGGIGSFLAAPTLTNFKTAITDETAIGWNLLTLPNPSAVAFLRLNADNTVTARSAVQLIGDLDADLTTWAGLTPSANAQSFVTAADYAAMRSLLGLVIGTNVQAFDADLTTWAGLTPSADAQSFVTAADYAAMRALLGLVIGANVQAFDADLTTWAGITPAGGIASFLALPTLANLKTAITDETAVGWNLFALANPGAITFLQLNADNTVTAQSASAQRAALGLGTLATQNGTFSGTSSGSNTGDQIVPVNTTATANQFFTAYNATTGVFTKAQPAFSDLSGSILDGQLPATLSSWAAVTRAAGFDIFAGAPTAANFNSLISDGDFIVNGTNPGAVTVTAGGTNQNITLTPSGTGQVFLPAGSNTLPGISTAGDPDTGIWMGGSNIVDVVAGGNTRHRFSAALHAMASGVVMGWSTTTSASAALDSGLSRISPGLVGVGTGAAGSFAGSLKLTDLIVVGHPTIEGVTSTGATGTGKFVFDLSPSLAGTPTAPTAAVNTDTTQLATTAFVMDQAGHKQTQTLGTAANSITFSVPSGYTNLRIIFTGRGDAAVAHLSLKMRFNGDTGTNYQEQFIYASNASAPGSDNAPAQSGIVAAAIPGTVTSANYAGVSVIFIPNYSGVFYKEITAHGSHYNGSQNVRLYGGTWLSTSAITSVTLLPDSGNVIAGTTATLIAE